MRPADRFFRICATILFVTLITVILWISAATAASSYIEDLTLNDLNSQRIPRVFRDGIITGVFLALTASQAMTCPLMTAEMLKAGLEAALAAKEISGDATVYHASLYVLVQAGCKATTGAVKEAPNA